MTISVTVPTSVRRPGSFHEFVHTSSGRGLVPLTLRVALVGQKSAAGTATAEQPVQVFDDAEADAKFGAGSELALMCRQAFAQARLQGTSPEIYGVPIAAPAGTANAQTLTVTGPATADGNAVIRIAGRTINVGITNGDAQNTIAAAIEKAIDAVASTLPVTAGVSTNVVTITHVTAGENGLEVAAEVVSKPAGVGIAIASSAAGSGTVDVTNALDSLVNKDYDAIALANNKSADVTDAKSHTATQWGYNEKRYRWIFIGARGTLSAANTLATGANDKTVLIVSCEGCPNLPGEIAAAAAVAAFGKEAPNANYDGELLDLYPPAAASAYTTAEQESALASGTTPLVPTPEGDRLQIVRLVTTKTTENGAPVEYLFDLAPSRTAAFMARQIDAGYKANFKQQPLTDEVRDRIRDMVVAVHRASETLGYIRDVDELLPQIQAEDAASPAGRVLVSSPIRVVSPLHQAVFLHTVFL